MKGIKRLEDFINELKNLQFEKIDSEGNRITLLFKFNEKAEKQEIREVEKKLGVKLPDSYVEFLLRYNGARLFDYEGLDGFWILGTKEIVDANNFTKATFEEDWNDNLIVFSKYIGESNYLAFESSNQGAEYNIVDCYFEDLPKEWRVIEENFDGFLYSIIERGGDKYWLE